MKSKICVSCKKEKPLNMFCLNKRQKDGFHYNCKDCKKIQGEKYRKTNKNKIKQYNIKNKDKKKEYNKQWFKNNKDKVREQKKLWEQNNKQKIKKLARNSFLLRKYNISKEEYDMLIKKQNNRCAICGLKETKTKIDGSIRDLSVDHDHKTGKIRGLLCCACNLALGYFKDDIHSLNVAIKYLNSNK